MNDVSRPADISIRRLILVPALITLGVTLLRLTGELQQWSPALFGREAGGGGALIGIAWLALIFGIYFALKLSRAGAFPDSTMKSISFMLLGLISFIAIVTIPVLLKAPFQVMIAVSAPASAVGIAIAWRGWPLLAETLLKYAVLARIPVVIVSLFAIHGNWGTHYDSPGPDVPPMGVWAEFFWTSLIPQMTLWLAYTVILGGLFGAIAVALAGRRKKVATATA